MGSGTKPGPDSPIYPDLLREQSRNNPGFISPFGIAAPAVRLIDGFREHLEGRTNRCRRPPAGGTGPEGRGFAVAHHTHDVARAPLDVDSAPSGRLGRGGGRSWLILRGIIRPAPFVVCRIAMPASHSVFRCCSASRCPPELRHFLATTGRPTCACCPWAEQLAQCSRQWEVILVNDGSRDDTSEVLSGGRRTGLSRHRFSRNFGEARADGGLDAAVGKPWC